MPGRRDHQPGVATFDEGDDPVRRRRPHGTRWPRPDRRDPRSARVSPGRPGTTDSGPSPTSRPAPARSHPPSSAVSARGMGAAWRPATRRTARASARVPPTPPASSGTEIQGSPMSATAAQMAGAHRRRLGLLQGAVGADTTPGRARPCRSGPGRCRCSRSLPRTPWPPPTAGSRSVPPRMVNDGEVSTASASRRSNSEPGRRGRARSPTSSRDGGQDVLLEAGAHLLDQRRLGGGGPAPVDGAGHRQRQLAQAPPPGDGVTEQLDGPVAGRACPACSRRNCSTIR